MPSLSEPDPDETDMKYLLETSTMRIPIAAAALMAVLSVGPVIARQPVPIAFTLTFTAQQPVVAVRAAVVRLSDAARAAVSVQPASAKDSAVGGRNGHGPMPSFAGPGPGWG
jgi:hypothetical protein